MEIFDNKEVLTTYEALSLANLPTENFEINVKTLQFKQSDLFKFDEGLYKPSTNTVYYGTYNPDVILHELIHAASSDRSNESFYKRGRKYQKSSGFTLINDNIDKIGISLSEGLTEYYRMKFYYNGTLDKTKFSCENYYFASILSRLLINLLGEEEVGKLFFNNDIVNFSHLLENKIGDTDGLIISTSDEIFDLNTESLISNMLYKSNKVNLTNMLIELCYRNIQDKNLENIFINHIYRYLSGDKKNIQVALKKLEKTKKKYSR